MYRTGGIPQWLKTKEDAGDTHIIVKFIKEFAISDPSPGAAGPYSTPLVLGFLSAPQSIQYAWGIGLP